ncbi:MAG: enoyl-CoA hydratase [Chloroflexi bacterium]|nr:enoyl-CoA hydratase [Chloroflexota bacterium]
MSTQLLSTLQSHVLTLTLNRPERANAFNAALTADLLKALREAAKNPEVRVIVLTGAGRVFSAGQDIEEMRSGGESLSYLEHLRVTYNPLILLLRQIEKPVIAAVNGPCAGASLGIALACDLRIASETANFVVGFNGIALAPDSGVSLLLPALIGLGRAAEFTFSNAPIPAQKALDWGLVNRVVPAEAFGAETAQIAAMLAQGPVGAYGLTKRAFNRAMYPNLEEVLEYEGQVQEVASHNPEHKEGVAAFLEKRRPKYV